MNRNSLSFKIISRILLFYLALGIVVITIYYYFSRTTIEEKTRENAIFLAENTINEIEEVIKPAEMIPENLSWMMETGSIPEDSLLSFLVKLVRQNPTIYGTTIAFEPNVFKEGVQAYAPHAFRNGTRVEINNLSSPDYNYFIADWYQIPATLQEPYWSEPYFEGSGEGALLSTYSVPFYVHASGERIFGGIITIDISLEWLTDIVNSVQIFETGYAFLLSRFGVYVTHPNRQHIMNETIFTKAKELNQPEMRTIGRSMIKGESNLTSITLKDRGFVWIYYTQLPATQWSMGVVYPHREMFTGLHQLNLIVLLVSLAGLALLVFFTVRIINRLISPLTKFSKSARIIAEGNFNVALPKDTKSDEMKELHDSFEFMQKELDNYMVNLKETTSAKEKIESELRIAREIQMGMIPHIFPPFPDLSEVDLFASLESAKEVGGDLYDFFLVDETRLCFAIGDVSGKGIPASLFMAVTRTLLRSVADKNKNTAEIVHSLNKTLAFNNESNMFVTFFVGILDIRKGELKFCNAGHNPPIMIRDRKEVNYFNLTKAIPIGLFEAYDYKEESMEMQPNDQIFLYTDGLTEAEDKNSTLFGDDHLLETIRQYPDASPEQMIKNTIKAVKQHVNGYAQSDDLTMMSITYFGKDAKTQTTENPE
jgi:phosphoserine phosphatase RsbU/P